METYNSAAANWQQHQHMPSMMHQLHQQQHAHVPLYLPQQHQVAAEDELDLNVFNNDFNDIAVDFLNSTVQQYSGAPLPCEEPDHYWGHLNTHENDDHLTDGAGTAPSTPQADGNMDMLYGQSHSPKNGIKNLEISQPYAMRANVSSIAPTLSSSSSEDHSECGSESSGYSQQAKDGRKRKNSKPYGRVLSTIKSNRAKQAHVMECAEIPKKENRVKGVVYVVNGDAKRWDGRQWRRLCIVHDCHSAARGSGDLCIAHSKGELQKVVIDNEVVEVVALGEEAAAQATAIAPVPSVIAAMKNAQPLGDKKRKAFPLDTPQSKYSRHTYGNEYMTMGSQLYDYM